MPMLRGEELRNRRQRRGEKPGEFAEAVRTSRSHLINLESGHRSCSIELAYRIADRLGCELDDLVDPAGVEPRRRAAARAKSA